MVQDDLNCSRHGGAGVMVQQLHLRWGVLLIRRKNGQRDEKELEKDGQMV